MKKFLSMFAIAAMSLTLFTACDDDEDAPELTPVDVAEGVYIINAGNSGNSISGSITYINSTTSSATQNLFKSANGRELGVTVNDAVVYGSKMYIVVTNENTVEVVDKNTMKSIKQIKTTDLMGAEKGLKPRHLYAYDGKVYVSAYGTTIGYGGDGKTKGYVAAIDTTSYSGTTYSVGAYPECMTVCNNKLYVANSSYGKGTAPSVSEIDLSTGTVNDLTNSLITNPVGMASVGNVVYIQDSGLYDEAYNQSGQGVIKYENGTFTKIGEATLMAVAGANTYSRTTAVSAKIYMINAPYSYPVTPVTYSVYDTSTGETSTFIDGSDIESPNGIAVDPLTRKVYILSYYMGDYGYADYSADGYVNEYSADGTFIKKYATGVGPTAVAFNSSVIYE